ncbi:MAG: hypothetical protein JST11_26715 [Acidobacteria bacterium]|nr:hypothetical protein [Acidobacteriota bacterium]
MSTRTLQLSIVFALTSALCHAQGIITTVAGNSKCCATTDAAVATSVWLPSANGIAVDASGNVYIWDGQSSKIRKVNAAGIITTIAGNGTPGYSGDGGPATKAAIFADQNMAGIAVDAAGNVYFSDGQNQVVRKIDTAGIVTTIAGNNTAGFSGDGGPATKAQLFYPTGLALDTSGNLYIADSSNNRVRRVDPAGTITTYAGNGDVSYEGDGVQATTTGVDRPYGLAIDRTGNLYISETSQSRVRRVDPTGIITTVAGQTKKTNGYTGDGGPATAATLSGPLGLAVDASGNLYIADNSNGRIRKVDAAGIITTYAGITGNASTPIGDGGPATSAYLGVPKDVALDSAGNLYIAGSAGSVARVRKIAASAGLTASPTALTFTAATGSAAPAAQSVSIASPSSAVTFTAAASTTSGGNWLSVTPLNGTTPATLIVAVNHAGLAAGAYQGAITITPNTSGISPLTFSVTLTVTGAGAPVINSGAIYNALGYQTRLAPGAVFVIFGSAMGPASLATGTGPDYPTTLSGTAVTFTPTSGGNPINAKMVYTVAGQIAGLLPSSIAPGAYAVRVLYSGIPSAPQPVTVVPRNFGIATANSAGTGTAQATIGNINGGVSLTRFTSGSVDFGGLNWTLSPAHPGDTLVLWGTGGGADPANDTGGSSGDQTAAGSFSVLVNGRSLTPLYAGTSSGYAGLWQINFTLPADIAPDCFAAVQVSAGGELSNTVTIPIAPAGAQACSDPNLSTALLAQLDKGGRIVVAGIAVSKNTATTSFVLNGATTTNSAGVETLAATFGSYTAAEYAAIYSGLKIGECTVNDRSAPASTPDAAAPDAFLDAGASLSASGPGLAAGAAMGIIGTPMGPAYDYIPAAGALSTGKYTVTGHGGKDIGAFTASVDFPGSFTIAGWDSLNTVTRSQPLTLNWTGGLDRVHIIFSTSAQVGKDPSNHAIVHTVSAVCEVPGAPGTYTIPTSVLSHLLPATIDAANSAAGVASLAVESGTVQTFIAPLTAGGQAAIAGFSSLLGYSRNLVVQ